MSLGPGGGKAGGVAEQVSRPQIMEDIGCDTGELELCAERGVIGVDQQLRHSETGDVGSTQEMEKWGF